MEDNKCVYIGAFLNPRDAEIFQDTCIEQSHNLVGEWELIENDIKYINAHWVVRILLEKSQKEFEFG